MTFVVILTTKSSTKPWMLLRMLPLIPAAIDKRFAVAIVEPGT
jgi:hypothetical protein